MEKMYQFIFTGHLLIDIIIGSLYLFSTFCLYKVFTVGRVNHVEKFARDHVAGKAKMLKCPNCSNDTWINGPGGGSFGNIKCCKCEKKYNNLGVFGLQEIK